MAVAIFQHIPGGKVTAVSVINTDIVIIVIVAVAVDQDNRDLRFLHFLIEFVRVHTDHDDAIQVSLLGQRQIAFIGIRRGNQNVIALLAGIVFDTAQNLTVKAVLKHQPVTGFCLRNHNANQLGIPHT